PLIAAYLGYRFAFPERRSELLETAPAVQAEALSSALAGKEAWMVSHPYPCDLGALFDAMAPVCGGSRRDRFDHIPSASSVSTTWATNVSGGVAACRVWLVVWSEYRALCRRSRQRGLTAFAGLLSRGRTSLT